MIGRLSPDGKGQCTGHGAVPLFGWAHSSLAVEAVDPAVTFLERAFGFTVAFREDGMSGQIASITGVDGLTCDLVQMTHPVSGHILELIAFSGAAPGDEAPVVPGGAHLAFLVGDIDAASETLTALGARRLGKITGFGDGPAAYFRIPGGAYLEIEQPVTR